MKKIIMLCTLLMISGCASNNSKKIQELEDKLAKLLEEKTKESTKDEESSKKDEEKKKRVQPEPIVFETPTLNLTLPQPEDIESNSIKKKLSLGVSNDIDFILLFDRNSYWVIAKPLKPNVSVDGAIIMNVTHQDKSPESFNFFQVQEGVFKTYGDNINGQVELEIIFSRENQKSIIFTIEATI